MLPALKVVKRNLLDVKDEQQAPVQLVGAIGLHRVALFAVALPAEHTMLPLLALNPAPPWGYHPDQ